MAEEHTHIRIHKKKFKKVSKPNLPHLESSRRTFRLFDFNTYDFKENSSDSDESSISSDSKKNQKTKSKDNSLFRIQMFGINEIGETCLIYIDGYKPYFYIKVGEKWDQARADMLLCELRKSITPFYASSIKSAILVKRCQLYEFTGNTEFNFVRITFSNMTTFNKVRNLWYSNFKGERKYTPYRLYGEKLVLYESKIPPLLRFFHIYNISPSGWVEIKEYTTIEDKHSTCNYEYICNPKQIIPLPDKETLVPYKICSFDIEASSSHGDFPLPKKDYKRFATQVVDIFISRLESGHLNNQDEDKGELILKKMILAAFKIGSMENIDEVYPKKTISKELIKKRIMHVLNTPLKVLQSENEESENGLSNMKLLKVTSMLQKIADNSKALKNSDNTNEGDTCLDNPGGFGSGIGEISDDTPIYNYEKILEKNDNTHFTIIQILLQPSSVFNREYKINKLNKILTEDPIIPNVKGDEVTFIGSTFMNYGEKEPHLNHCIVVGSCDNIPGVTIKSVKTESACLKAWARLIQDENPDIIIGYNIFGFDYTFMFQRAQELSIVDEFMSFSRILNEPCYKRNYTNGEKMLEQTKNRLASGDYDLQYPKTIGRLQIDLLFYFRRDYNLSSYKLDDVASSFIRDDIKALVPLSDSNKDSITHIYTKNIMGLNCGDFIHLEITTFTTDYYRKGKKFKVLDIIKDHVINNSDTIQSGKYNVIVISGHYLDLDYKNQVLKWGMSKDDVTPQDIFRLSKESSSSRAIVAKYCIQDCNLVQHLMNKTDILTGYNEMSRICNVPTSFLVFRGQGIKLTSYVAKVCKDKNTLMPDLEYKPNDDGYEGAIVLPPKCDMYAENPVACNDYSSLYPSIAKGWNLSPNSKVWTKLYDLEGNLLKINDITVTESNLKLLEQSAEKYDNLTGYEYIYTSFDHFETVHKRNSNGGLGKKEKVKRGKKVCRWAQFPNGQEGIIPCIIGDLLKARKDTRVKAESESDPFIANVLDKRQLGYKVTANSLYGQMGSSVSTFFEKDVAASITAIGRMMITYAKRMVEEIYGNITYTSTKYSQTVRVKSSYVYGDTDSVFFTFNLEDIDTGNPIRGKRALELTIELAQEAADLCSLFLPPPMKLAYEKTLMSFILLSKKRYVGMLYETDPNKGKLKFMGLPLKRRDSCDYVKDVYGGILTILMKEPDNIKKAIDFLNTMLKKLVNGEVSMEKLSITKSLRSEYKNPLQISHKVLANRIGDRDPGNRPKPGDRIKFVFITNKNKNALLGERIETPDFIVNNKLDIDYTYYITNQLMNPLQQLLGLALTKIYQYKNINQSKFIEYNKNLNDIQNSSRFQNGDLDLELYMKKKEKYCSSQVKKLLFDPFLTDIYNKQHGIRTIFQFYNKT